jgi:hypothetical protein
MIEIDNTTGKTLLEKATLKGGKVESWTTCQMSELSAGDIILDY